MGQVKRILAAKQVNPLPDNYCGIELCETVHIHLPGYRLEFNTANFEVLADVIHRAWQNWIAHGKPSTAEFIALAGHHFPSDPVYPNRFEVEEQTIPAIHIHLRGLSIRSSIPAFIEFAEVIEEAKRNLTR